MQLQKKYIINIFLLIVSLTFVFGSLLQALRPNFASSLDMGSFQKLPVQEGGRIKPIDTIARNNLLMLRGKQTVPLPDSPNKKLSAIQWLMDVTMRPEVANTYKIFRIDNPEVLGLFGWEQNKDKYFSFNDLSPHLDSIVKQVSQINKEKALRTTFEQQLYNLYESLLAYNRLIAMISTVGKPDMLEQEYATWTASITPGMEAIRDQENGKSYDTEALTRFVSMADRYLDLAKMVEIGIVPPLSNKNSNEKWSNIGQALLDVIVTQQFPEVIINYAKLIVSYRQMDVETFNETLANLHKELNAHSPVRKVNFEVFFNNFEPFYISSILYLLVFLITCVSWLWKGGEFTKTALFILLIAFLLHTFGLIARMYIQGRPPVTNLYSSAIFIGWASVLIGLIIERVHKNTLGAAVASIVGFATLIIAHNLGAGNDTLEMMRAVLDSNFWLSTHVVTVTMGYSAMFLMGLLGIFYILGNLKQEGLDPQIKQSLSQMVFGILCFATLFSFVGTMLGGIWADQSWGRFWGWDPKENGALLIVLWCAIMLHARWGRLVQDRGLMIMAIFGNCITSWSWFGTNMLGVGLHSYGFMDRAFWILMIFILIQLALIAIGLLFPRKRKGNQSLSTL